MTHKAFDGCAFSFAGKPMGVLTDLVYTTIEPSFDLPSLIPDEPGMITLPPGYEIKQMLPPTPPEDFMAVMQTVMSKVASRLGIPMNLATTSQGCNFASALHDADVFRRRCQSSIPFGTPIVPCEWMVDRVWTQVRFPRSKKKRIRKKWRKDSRNFRIVEKPWPAYLANGTLFCHTSTYLALKRSLAVDGEAFVAGNRILDPLRLTTGASP